MSYGSGNSEENEGDFMSYGHADSCPHPGYKCTCKNMTTIPRIDETEFTIGEDISIAAARDLERIMRKKNAQLKEARELLKEWQHVHGDNAVSILEERTEEFLEREKK